MKTLALDKLRQGMIVAEPVYSKTGQALIPAGVVLTQKHINRLEFYNIRTVSIASDSEALTAKDSMFDLETKILDYEKNVRDTVEYKYFKKTFVENIDQLSLYINDVILRYSKENEHSLLQQMLDFFDSINEEINVMEVLHQLRTTDYLTYTHSINVAIICRLMGQWLHFSKSDIDVLTLCGLLHDIGKCQIPSTILSKPDKLTDDEYTIMKSHSLNGYNILKNLPIDPRVKRAALMHHERCDGTGYPLGLMCEEIDSFSVIVSIADVYDAMTSNRCYRDAICPFEVIEAFEKEGFHKYNPTFISTFLNHVVDTYMNYEVMLNNGSTGQIVWKNKDMLGRPTIYLPSKEFLDLSKHPEIQIQKII